MGGSVTKYKDLRIHDYVCKWHYNIFIPRFMFEYATCMVREVIGYSLR